MDDREYNARLIDSLEAKLRYFEMTRDQIVDSKTYVEHGFDKVQERLAPISEAQIRNALTIAWTFAVDEIDVLRDMLAKLRSEADD